MIKKKTQNDTKKLSLTIKYFGENPLLKPFGRLSWEISCATFFWFRMVTALVGQRVHCPTSRAF